jgi:hypothetical protein
MRASIYNNPLFADGLAGIIENYMGNPDRERAIARDELDMQRGQLDLESARLRNDALRQQMALRGAAGGGGGGGSGGVDPARLGALFAQLGQPQGASPYSTGTPVTGDFIAPSQPLSFGEAMPAAMPQAMPAPPSPMAEGLSFGEIVTEPPAPVDRHEQIGRLLMEAEANPQSYIDPTQKAYFKALEAMYERTAPEEVNPMDPLDLKYRELQIQQLQQDIAGGGASPIDGLNSQDYNRSMETINNWIAANRSQGFTPANAPAIQAEALAAYESGRFATLDQAVNDALSRSETTVTEDNWWGEDERAFSIRPLLDVGQPQLPGGVVRVQTEADVEALPSGAQFMTPDGKIKVKP